MYQQILVKCPNIKFHGNLFRDSVIITSRQMDRHGNADRCVTTTFHCELTKKCLLSSVKFSHYSEVLKLMVVNWTGGKEW
jgi:hypothetical protein